MLTKSCRMKLRRRWMTTEARSRMELSRQLELTEALTCMELYRQLAVTEACLHVERSLLLGTRLVCSCAEVAHRPALGHSPSFGCSPAVAAVQVGGLRPAVGGTGFAPARCA